MSFGGTNLDKGHAYNRRLILEAIRVHGALSRAELTRLTGLAPQTVSNISATLTEAGLLLAERRPGTSRGQPPTDLRLNPDGGYAFGVSIDSRHVHTVLLDIAGNHLGDAEVELEDVSPQAVIPHIVSSIARLDKAAKLPKDRILGTGIAMTGLSTFGSFIGLAPDDISIGWHGFPLVTELERALDMPIFTDNDARAAGVGEAFYGKGRTYRDFIYIYFGTGIGGRAVSAGQPFRGSQGRGGEFGHMIVEPNGRPCQCGNRGCLEQYASLTSALKAIHHEKTGMETQRALIAALDRGDPGLLQWVEEAAFHLRTAIVNLENIFDPEAVLLGGIIPEPLLDAIVERLTPLPRTVASRRADRSHRVVKASIGPTTPAMGAASLALFDATSADFSLLFKKSSASGTIGRKAERR